MNRSTGPFAADSVASSQAQRVARQRHERTTYIAIVTQPDVDDLLYRLPVGTTRYRAYARRGHPLTARRRLSLRDLADKTVIVPEDGSQTRSQLHRKYGELGVTLPHLVKTPPDRRELRFVRRFIDVASEVLGV